MAGDNTPATDGWHERASEPYPERAATTSKGKILISVPLDEAGRPAWDKVRDKTTTRFKELLLDPETQRRFGVGPARAGEEFVDPQLVHSFLDFLAQLQIQIFMARYKLTREEATEIATYSDLEKKVITPPAQRVLAKRAPEFIIKYGDEITLAGLLFNTTRLKMTLAAELQKRKEGEPAEPDQEKAEVLQ